MVQDFIFYFRANSAVFLLVLIQDDMLSEYWIVADLIINMSTNIPHIVTQLQYQSHIKGCVFVFPLISLDFTDILDAWVVMSSDW